MESPTNPVTGQDGGGTTIGGGAGQRRGVAAEEVRRHNLGAVVERLHLTGPLSRSELADVTGLNRSTIADLLAELAELGLVEERAGTPHGTRPPLAGRSVQAGGRHVARRRARRGLDRRRHGRSRRPRLQPRPRSRPRRRFSPEETSQDVAKLAGPLLDALPGERVLVGRRRRGRRHHAPIGRLRPSGSEPRVAGGPPRRPAGRPSCRTAPRPGRERGRPRRAGRAPPGPAGRGGQPDLRRRARPGSAPG